MCRHWTHRRKLKLWRDTWRGSMGRHCRRIRRRWLLTRPRQTTPSTCALYLMRWDPQLIQDVRQWQCRIWWIIHQLVLDFGCGLQTNLIVMLASVLILVFLYIYVKYSFMAMYRNTVQINCYSYPKTTIVIHWRHFHCCLHYTGKLNFR